MRQQWMMGVSWTCPALFPTALKAQDNSAVIDLGQTHQGVLESPEVIAAALASSRRGA